MANPEHVAKLMEGSDAWKSWLGMSLPLRRSIDLRGADLSFARLGPADLEGMNLTGAILKHAHLPGARMMGAKLDGADLTGIALSNANLTDTTMLGSKLSYADLAGATLLRAKLAGSRMNHAHLDGAVLRDADLSGVDLNEAKLNNAKLTRAMLARTKLRNADFSDSDLTSAKLVEADLSSAKLGRANLAGADFHRADLTGADLTGAKVTSTAFGHAKLVKASLIYANLRHAQFWDTDLSYARLDETLFIDTNLSSAHGLETCVHVGPSTIDDRTLARSGRLPLEFLRGCGLPNMLIQYIPSIFGQGIQFYSCFISYSTKDQEFADRIYADLQNKGVRCWFAPHDIQGGKKIHEQIDEAIKVYDRLLLILSESSMASPWVSTEIGKARKRERALEVERLEAVKRGEAKERRRVLFPVGLVGYEAMREWECFDGDLGTDSAKEIREYYIPDFSGWKTDHDGYKREFERLVRDLKAK